MTVQLDLRAFAYYHPGYHQWITEDGEFDILIGTSSADIRCTKTVTLQTTLDLPCILNRESTIRDWLAYPRGRSVFDPVFQRVKTQMGAVFGDGENSDSLIGMDALGFLMDMPLLSLLQFQENTLSMPADELVDDLLRQVHETRP